MERLLVMVVDDTPEVRELFARVLERAGYDVLTAAGGAEGLALLEEHIPDAILLDYLMPDIDGPAFLRRLRASPTCAEVPVILLTALNDPTSIERGFEAGATDYVTKPVDRRILLARLESLIDRSRAVRKAFRADELEKQNDSYQSELSRAHDLQCALLPHTPLRFDDVNVVGALAASGHVGGDLFDVVEGMAGARVCVLLDVSGHGLASAMVAASVRSMLRLLLRTTSIEGALRALNEQLVADVSDDHYVCVGLVELLRGGARVINAGLPPIVITESSGGRLVSASGVPPGLIRDAEYEVEWVPSAPGQRIVLASDGVSESVGASDDVVTPLRALGILATDPCPAGASALSRSALLDERSAERLSRAIEAFYGSEREDDVTVLVIDDLRAAGAELEEVA
jgi:phosphoserine phosphatase RsbU/P